MIAFSGDGDFSRVYEYVVNELKKKVIVYSTMNKRTHTKIKLLGANKVITLEDLASFLNTYGEKLLTP